MRKLATEIEYTTGRVFRLLVRVGLGALIVLYAVAIFINRELGLVDKIERPLVLASLLLVLTVLVRIERRLPRDGNAEVTVYGDRAHLYESTRRAVENARHRVFVTYLRAKSPNELDAAVQQHFRACRKWAGSSPRHVFRRVIINADNPSMADYMRQELAEVRRARSNGRHYNVRVLNYVVHDADAISIGIYDDDQVFISYASGTDRIVGVGIRSREVVRECFEHYYDHLWSSATDIEECSS